jgi:uncharacterized protein (TIGR02594 family)
MSANAALLAAARLQIGTAEIPGPKSNAKVVGWIKRCIAWLKNESVDDSEWAWCGVFIYNLCVDLGLPTPAQAYRAANWLKVGTAIPTAQAMPGDVVVMKRPGGFHVTLFDGWTTGQKSAFYALGGNQGDRVCVSTYFASNIVGVRRLG